MVLVSAMHQHESAVGTRMPPPFWTSLPPPSPYAGTESQFELPESCNKFTLATILHMAVYMVVYYVLQYF